MCACKPFADCCRAPGLALLPDEVAARLASLAKALSDPIRVQIIHLLELHADLCTCEFEELLGLTQSKVSYHLKVLLDAGLVTRRICGTWSHYSLAQPAVLNQLRRLDMTKHRVAFICTGNSCRSQIAEGWARALAGDRWEVYSAGLEAHGVNPRAVQIMAEAGIDISGQTSKTIDIDRFQQQDVIITLCGDANERCPVIPPTALVRQHWDLPDPAKATGTEAEILAQFRAVRDEIQRRMQALLAELDAAN